ncbi:hypothetical protein PN419_07075 [Halorubrum ezzemoulense]|jgi:uncharacterized membrane protein HdeD (DUF308 family)|uniref:Uncharacterized protein n=2 Tax=Halorubrum ezzemoulense TaxID=337243 RepID=A0A256IUV1_HALEZ|nr:MULTISPECIES: hypothetical protein [Halorubrum]MDB2224341.1 hypothetical protein [Halorubrum ezzemoulense]MDB2238276.1 hypothetical protein [Halorubrum ezzemoulense]MDB2240071.1 hypothetical protein [Halorubrum ezzemoulense]MDB2243995.1 hypothetical protein [Halorubrum ezzemoulense]MDB2247745.1 hypothetical protein [Halorubrum ezzemoulense]
MRDTLGLEGIAGVLVVLVGIGILTLRDPVVAGALMVVLAGLALIAKGLVDTAMRSFGLK